MFLLSRTQLLLTLLTTSDEYPPLVSDAAADLSPDPYPLPIPTAPAPEGLKPRSSCDPV